MRALAFILLLCFSRPVAGQFTDLGILKTLNARNMPAWDKSMRGLSFTVYPLAPLSVAGTLSYGYVKKDKTMIRNGYKSAVAICLAMTLSTALKYGIARQRPYDADPDIIQRDTPGTHSFPSGHTTAAFATATTLSLSHKKWYVTAPAFIYAGFVGYSRMRLGVHYPTDVLAGAILGIGSGFLTWEMDKLLLKRKKQVAQEN